LVVTVEKGSPAERAGVESSDIITKVDGKLVDSQSDLPRYVASIRPGSKATWKSGARAAAARSPSRWANGKKIASPAAKRRRSRSARRAPQQTASASW